MPSLPIRHPLLSSAGLNAALVSAASYGLMSFLVHWNPRQHPVEQLIFLRGLLSCLILLPFCYREIGKYFRKDSLSLWIRCVAGSGGVVCYFYALQGTVSANANLVFSSSPIFVTFFAWALFREKISRLEALGIAAILFGNFLLYLPNRATIEPWVWMVGSTGALFASVAFLSLGAATKKYSTSLIVLGFAFTSALLCLLLPGRAWLPLDWADAAFLLAVSLLGLLSQFTSTLSFFYLKSGVATAIGRSSILFSGLFDILIARYHPHALEWVSYLVVLAGIVLAHRPAPKKPVKTPI